MRPDFGTAAKAWLVIGVAIGVALGPAVIRVFASDHLWYLAELNGARSLLAGLALTDYKAVQQFWPGDVAVFRPLTYVWFAVQNWLYGSDYVAWNVTALVVHFLVCVGAWHVMRLHRPSPLALPLALLAAVGFPPIEGALWHNVTGFAWATLALLVGLALLQRGLDATGSRQKRHLVLWCLVTTLAVFFAEFSLPLALLGAVAWTRSQRVTVTPGRSRLLSWLPVSSFAVAYAWHLWHVHVRGVSFDGFWEVSSIEWLVRVPGRFFLVSLHWLYRAFNPGALTFSPLPYDRLSAPLEWSPGAPDQFVGMLLSFVIVVGFLRAIRLAGAPVPRLVVAAPLSVLLIYCVGRQSSEMLTQSYYLYPVWVLALVALHAAIDVRHVHGLARRLLPVVVWAYVTLHASLTLRTSVQIRESNTPAHRYHQALSAVRRDHRNEPNFSMTIVDRDESLDPPVYLRLSGLPEPDGPPERGLHRFASEIIHAPAVVHGSGKLRVSVGPDGEVSLR